MVNLKDFNTFRPKHLFKKSGIDRERKKYLNMLREKGLHSEYKIFGKFRGIKKVNKFKHKICGKIFEMNGTKLLDGARCPECAKAKASKYQSMFAEIIKTFNIKDLELPVITDETFVIGSVYIGDMFIRLLKDGRLEILNSKTDKPFTSGNYRIDEKSIDSMRRIINRHGQILFIKKHYELKHMKLFK